MIIPDSIGIHISTFENKLCKLSYYSCTLIIKWIGQIQEIPAVIMMWESKLNTVSKAFYVYTHIMSIFDVRLCVGMFIQEDWPLLRLLILLTLIWWQVSNLSKIRRIVLPWIQRAIDGHFGWNHWSIICLSKVSIWVSNLSKEWIWYAKSGISGLGVWSISRSISKEKVH